MFSKEQDQAFLRAAIEVSRKSVGNGNHPFGCVLVDKESGQIVLEYQNNYKTDNRLGHAEANLARMAAVQFEEDYLRGCTMYTTVEPCCMCAGTAYWAELGAVVFGVTEARLGALTGSHPENLTMDLPCRTVFNAGRRPVSTSGVRFPELETEILKVHEGFWT